MLLKKKSVSQWKALHMKERNELNVVFSWWNSRLGLRLFTSSSTGDHHLFCQKHFQWHEQNNAAVITRISMDWEILRAFTKGIFIAVLKTFAFLNRLTNSRNRRFEIRVAPFGFAFAMLTSITMSSHKCRVNMAVEKLLSWSQIQMLKRKIERVFTVNFDVKHHSFWRTAIPLILQKLWGINHFESQSFSRWFIML